MVRNNVFWALKGPIFRLSDNINHRLFFPQDSYSSLTSITFSLAVSPILTLLLLHTGLTWKWVSMALPIVEGSY